MSCCRLEFNKPKIEPILPHKAGLWSLFTYIFRYLVLEPSQHSDIPRKIGLWQTLEVHVAVLKVNKTCSSF